MKKEDILEKSRKSKEDERNLSIDERALTVSGLAVVLSIGVFMIIRAINALQIYDLLSILFAYLTANYLYRFVMIKKPLWLILGIVFAAGMVTYGALYILSVGW